jgi:hypothetical protein
MMVGERRVIGRRSGRGEVIFEGRLVVVVV